MDVTLLLWHSHPLGAQKLGQALKETTSWTSWIATLRTQLKVGFSSKQCNSGVYQVQMHL